MRVSLGLVVLVALACSGGKPGPSSSSSEPAGPSTTPSTPAANPVAPSAVSIERIDPAAECDGLVPDGAPAPVTFTRTPPAGFACAGGTSDGTGHVAVAARSGADASWQAFGPDGTPEATFGGWPVIPEPSGWHALAVSTVATGAGAGHVVQELPIAPDGATGAAVTISNDPSFVATTGWSASPDPLGGSFVLVASYDLSNNHWGGLRAQRLDAGGAPRWAAPVQLGARSDPTIVFLAGGVSRAGDALAVWQQSAWVDVAWLGSDGQQVAGAELVERPDAVFGSAAPVAPALSPLLDGGLAVRAGGAYRRVYPHLATTTAPLPQWLADRAAWTFRITRGNRGYAAFPPPGQDAPACAQQLDLVAPSGRLCGRVTLPGDGKPCATGELDQGWDGTVVQQTAAGSCTYRSWPRLLAGP